MPHDSLPSAHSPGRSRSLGAALGLLAFSLLAFGGLGPVGAADDDIPRSEKWYEQSESGNKTGYVRVVWTPSTWKGKNTVHDTTTFVSRSTRNMAGMRDTFSVTTTLDLERGVDGTMWWTQSRVEEPERVTLTETVWTGTGYRYSAHIVGQESNRETFEVPLDAPVMTDAESFLGVHIRAGDVKVGSKYELRNLDLRARTHRPSQLEVVAQETVKDETGAEIEVWKVVETDPASKSESMLWLDNTGVLLRLRSGTVQIARTTQAAAEQMPTRTAEYDITVGSEPRLERIFSADRVLADVRLRPDADLKLPEFPTSPWSRALATKDRGDDGTTISVELRAYDSEVAKAKIPVIDKAYARWLEATAQMQVGDPLVLNTVRAVVGEEADVRAAAYKLARFVYTELDKKSLRVAQGDAVQILTERCGDCSEHCLLFVTLCRAAGIPARRCSGYVCIGGMWGAHAWAEIWTGQWIGADPTTGEIGTGARYLFFGYPDEPDSYPNVVSSRVTGRLRILVTRVEEGAAGYDLADPEAHRIYDVKGRRFVHVLCGLEARGVPEDWSVTLSDDRSMRVRGPSFTSQISASADQGADIESVARFFPGKRTTFAGAPALVRANGSSRTLLVFSRRRMIQMTVSGADGEALAALEGVLAPTFAVPALAWEAAPAAGAAEAEDR
ncbi:MAG: transglutaminase-like domain-containing protein [Planctomycetota bacterium]|nr:transglutaminase-like domain-containing protein [Planctomycetota bacterium]